MENYCERCQSSVIKIKESSIIWSYRDCDLEFGFRLSDVLIEECRTLILQYDLSVIVGSTFIEFKSNKTSNNNICYYALNELARKDNIIEKIFYFGTDIDGSMESFFSSLTSQIESEKEIEKSIKLELVPITLSLIKNFSCFYLDSISELKEVFEKIVLYYEKQNKTFL